jgi:hypothetical protein
MKNVESNCSGFITNSFYPAAFLLAKGYRLLSIDKSDSRRMEFVFDDSDSVRQLFEDFNYAKVDEVSVLIDARQFIVAVKSLKEKMYQG